MDGQIVIDDTDAAEIVDLLVGRRIVDAGSKRVVEENSWGRSVSRNVDYLTLDDNTELRVVANSGCGGCSSGNYWINSVAAFPNVITRVELTDEATADDYGETLEIHVYAEGASATVLSVSGDEGNGYYGRGCRVMVVRS
jgi:hypothetical protein